MAENQYFITQRFEDNGTPILLDRSENHNVFDNKIVLDSIPDEFNKVKIISINGIDTDEMVEIPYYSVIENSNQFKVDYKVTGFVYFDPSRETETMGIMYKGKGYVCVSPNRIATIVSEDGKTILQTLSDLTEIAQTNADYAKAQGDSANTVATNSNNMVNDFKVFENYVDAHPYIPLNKVSYQGSSYICIANCQGIAPSTDQTKWLMIAQKGNDGLSSMLFSTFTATSNNTLHIVHNLNYVPTHDYLQVIDVAYNCIMTKGANYTENADNISIDLNSTTGILTGEQIQFILFKNIK